MTEEARCCPHCGNINVLSIENNIPVESGVGDITKEILDDNINVNCYYCKKEFNNSYLKCPHCKKKNFYNNKVAKKERIIAMILIIIGLLPVFLILCRGLYIVFIGDTFCVLDSCTEYKGITGGLISIVTWFLVYFLVFFPLPILFLIGSSKLSRLEKIIESIN